MKCYRVDVMYKTIPYKLFPYFFLARSAQAVAKATGFERKAIFKCTKTEALKSGRHIDIVKGNKLTEVL